MSSFRLRRVARPGVRPVPARPRHNTKPEEFEHMLFEATARLRNALRGRREAPSWFQRRMWSLILLERIHEVRVLRRAHAALSGYRAVN